MSDTWTRGHTPDTRYATWRIVDHIVGQRFRTRLGHDLIILINNFNLQQRKKEDGERKWEAVDLVPGFSIKEKGERENGEGRREKRGR